MANSPDARSADDFGTNEPRKLKDWTDHPFILNTFTIVKLDKDGKEPQYGPYAVLQLTDTESGEIFEMLAGQKYVLAFLEKVGSPSECPIKVQFVKVGKAFGVRGW